MDKNADIKKLLGKRIKELRISKNLSQEQLAELIDITERSMSKIECGENFVRAETLSKITEALGVEESDLFNFKHLRDEKELKAELINAISSNKVDIRLLYKFYKSII